MERQIKKFNKLSKSGEEDQIQGSHSKHQSDHSKEQVPENVKKWVINLSSIPLTKDQEDLLAHGPYFLITPQNLPWENILQTL